MIMRLLRFLCKERLPHSAIIFDPMALHILGISHHSAPLEVREKLAFAPERQTQAVAELAAQPGIAEALLLSTCNRTEVYFCAEDGAAARAWLEGEARKSGLSLGQHLYSHS